jgi:fibronectin type 3 domain-containing protein
MAATHSTQPAKARHYVHLTWHPGKGGTEVVGYNVYRTTGKHRHFRKINRSLVAKPEYDDRTVSSGVTYRYMVSAVDAKGTEGGFSNQIRLFVPR